VVVSGVRDNCGEKVYRTTSHTHSPPARGHRVCCVCVCVCVCVCRWASWWGVYESCSDGI
jgi:hypothetical protein